MGTLYFAKGIVSKFKEGFFIQEMLTKEGNTLKHDQPKPAA